MKCVILQPSYIPWRGFFHQIQKADVFVFYDDVQYDSRGWRQRNRVKGPQGVQWLTIPVHHRGSQTRGTPICEIPICWDTPWNERHWSTLRQFYGKSPHFARYAESLETCFLERPTLLADYTIEFTKSIAAMLGIDGTRFLRSSQMAARGQKTERLLNVLKQVGADHYISGPSAKDYLDESLLAAAGIRLEYMTYQYPEYPQLYPPYDPQVSILDLLFMVGPAAPEYMGVRRPYILRVGKNETISHISTRPRVANGQARLRGGVLCR